MEDAIVGTASAGRLGLWVAEKATLSKC